MDYIEDASHLLQDTHTVGEEEFEATGCVDVDADDLMNLKRAENALKAGLRMLERFKSLNS